MKLEHNQPDEEILPEYNFTGGIRGQYANRYYQNNNIIVLEPDVTAAFPTSSQLIETMEYEQQ